MQQLNNHYHSQNLLSEHQSEYKQGFSGETFPVKLTNKKKKTQQFLWTEHLMAIDLSTAFDTEYQDFQLHVLKNHFRLL